MQSKSLREMKCGSGDFHCIIPEHTKTPEFKEISFLTPFYRHILLSVSICICHYTVFDPLGKVGDHLFILLIQPSVLSF